jgi:hypothetical protein
MPQSPRLEDHVVQQSGVEKSMNSRIDCLDGTTSDIAVVGFGTLHGGHEFFFVLLLLRVLVKISILDEWLMYNMDRYSV